MSDLKLAEPDRCQCGHSLSVHVGVTGLCSAQIGQGWCQCPGFAERDMQSELDDAELLAEEL